MKILFLLTLCSALLIPQCVFAHGDHEYRQPLVISEGAAIIVAQRAARSMSQRDAGLGFGQLNESWASVPRVDLAIYKKGVGYYVVSLLNRNEQQTLYVLMSDSGEVYDANQTGEFDGVE